MSGADNPKPGDVILRAIGETAVFELVDAASHRVVAKDIPSMAAAIEAARLAGAGEIWQQHVDFRGRPLGDPFRLLRQFK